MYRSLFILLPTLAFALPSLNKRDDESIWKASDGKGNIKVYFSDTNTNWGDWEPSTWLDDLDCDSARECTLVGDGRVLTVDIDCKDITRKTKILDTIPEDYDVKLSFNEDYNPDMLEDMTAALKAALYESRYRLSPYHSRRRANVQSQQEVRGEMDGPRLWRHGLL